MATAQTTPKRPAAKTADKPKNAPKAVATTEAAQAPALVQGYVAPADQALVEDVKQFITENKLAATLDNARQRGGADRAFVNVEGWQYAGSRLGLTPIVEYCQRAASEAGEIKYEAKVTIFDLNRLVTVGGGFAICSTKEPNKKDDQEFVISSMAQTRAIGKAFRNMIAWVITAAGFASTPREEMDSIGAGTKQNSQQQPASAPPAAPKAIEQPSAPAAPAEAASEPEKQNGNDQAAPADDDKPKSPKLTPNAAAHMKPEDVKATGKEGKIMDQSKDYVASNIYGDLDQKQQIICLCADPYIRNDERAKVIKMLHTSSRSALTISIGKMNQEIQNRRRLHNDPLKPGEGCQYCEHPALADQPLT